MALKPKKIDKKAFAPDKNMRTAVSQTKDTPADTKALEQANAAVEKSAQELGAAMEKTQTALQKLIDLAPDVAKKDKPSKTPMIPYPNFAKVEKEAKKAVADSEKALKKLGKAHSKLVKVADGATATLSSYVKSSGDEAGAAAKKGILTGKNMSKARFQSFSFDVKVEGKNIQRAMDLMLHSSKKK